MGRLHRPRFPDRRQVDSVVGAFEFRCQGLYRTTRQNSEEACEDDSSEKQAVKKESLEVVNGSNVIMGQRGSASVNSQTEY